MHGSRTWAAVFFFLLTTFSVASWSIEIQWYTPQVAEFDFSGDKLTQQWQQLHIEDRYALPTAESIKQRFTSNQKIQQVYAELAKQSDISAYYQNGEMNFAAMTAALLDTSRLLHSGKLEQAYAAGNKLGHFGLYVASQALYINTFFLEENLQKRDASFKYIVDNISAAEEIEPNDLSFQFMHIYALGRYVETKEFSMDMLAYYNLMNSSTKQLTKENHAHLGANLIRAAFWAQGSVKSPFLSRMRFGSTPARSIEHFDKILTEQPNTIIGHYTYADNLIKMGKNPDDQIKELEKAVAIKPWDVNSALSSQLAAKQLKSLQSQRKIASK